MLDWCPRFADHECARLADSWLRPMALCRTFGHGWVVCLSLSVLMPIGLHAVTALVVLTVSSGFILAPPPYRMVNAGSCDYKIKKKKKKNTYTAKLCTLPHVRKFVLDAFTPPGVAQVTLSETTTNIKPLLGRRNIFTPVPSMLFKPFTPPRGTEMCAAWIPSIPIAEY